MFASFRRLFGLVLCLALIGFFRGWFSVSSVSKDAASNKVNFSVSVDTNKVEADAEEMKDTIEEDVAEMEEESQSKPEGNAVSGERATGIGETDGQSGIQDRPYHRYSV